MSTKTQKALAKAKASAARARARAKENRSRGTRRVAMAGSAYFLGTMVRSGTIERFPTVFGLPRMAVISAAGLLASEYVGGMAGDVLEGAGEAALAIAGFQLGSEGTVSGGVVREDRGVIHGGHIGDAGDGLSDLADMEQAMLEAETVGYEEELAAIEEEAAAADTEAALG